MPDVLYGRFLLNYMSRLGWVMKGEAIPYTEFESWARMTKVSLSGWEFETLRILSVSYANELMRARRPDCPSPLEEQEGSASKDRSTSPSNFRAIR